MKTEKIPAAAGPATEAASIVFLNGRVYTAEPGTDWAARPAEALVVQGDTIAYVGGNAGAQASISPASAVVDLKGKMLLPGFVDAHQHLSQGGVEEYCTLKLFHCCSLEEYKQEIKDYLRARPRLRSLRGIGWKNDYFPNSSPTKEMLDALTGDIPAMLISMDHHSVWANSRALTLAGVTRETENPTAGVIEHDPATGEPNGIFRELAMDLIDSAIPNFPFDDVREAVLDSQARSQSYGITTVLDPNLYLGEERAAVYRALEESGELGIRVRGALFFRPANAARLEALLPAYVEERERNRGRLFQTNTIKLGMDGVVEGVTAYLKQPYRNRPGCLGVRKWEDGEALGRVAAAFDKAGFQLHAHTIGDAAAALFLDALEHTARVNGRRDSRPCLAHLQVVDPADLPRFKRLGAIAVPSPFWFVKDERHQEMDIPYLGEERAAREYPMKSFFDLGITVASSSDWPATRPYHPLLGIQTGITRCLPEAAGAAVIDADVLGPEERVSLAQMIESYTINGAKALFLENETGSLAPGKRADLVVLAENLFELPAKKIGGVPVLLTMLEGKAVYGSLNGLD